MDNGSKRYIHRDAGTGRIVSEEYARQNPLSTTRETVHDDVSSGELWETRNGSTAKVLHRFAETPGRTRERVLLVLQHPGLRQRERITWHGLDGRVAPGGGVDSGDDLVKRLRIED